MYRITGACKNLVVIVGSPILPASSCDPCSLTDHLQLRLLRPRQGPGSQKSSGDDKNCSKESILIIYVAFSVAEGVIYVLFPVIRYFCGYFNLCGA